MILLVVAAAGFLFYRHINFSPLHQVENSMDSGFRALVELDVFSGRPNPVWTLDKTFTENFFERISRLSPARTIQIDGPGQLGYQGFRITLTASSEQGSDSAIVFGGKITLIRNRQRMYYDNQERQLEIWLLSTSAAANPPVEQGLLEELVADISTGK